MQPCEEESDKIYKIVANAIFDVLNESSMSKLIAQFGLTEEDVRQLSELSRNGQREIFSKAPKFLSVKFDRKKMMTEAEAFLRKNTDIELENEFLLLHAPHKMMRELFGLFATEFSARRKKLGLGGQGKHRPYYCNGDTESAIWQYWEKNEQLEIRQRFLKVAEQSGQPLNIVWAAVRRYDELS